MKRTPQPPEETVQLDLELNLVKELLRDLLFREAGQPYFRRFAVPRRRRWFGAWRTLSTYQAERQLLPVGGRDMNRLIQAFFTTHSCLRAEFYQDGMPVSAIGVLRQCCPPLHPLLVRIYSLECAQNDRGGYQISLRGSPGTTCRDAAMTRSATGVPEILPLRLLEGLSQ